MSTGADDLSKNPFAALFPSLQHAEEYIRSTKDGLYLEQSQEKAEPIEDEVLQTKPGFTQQVSTEWQVKAQIINDFLQRGFLFTVNSGNVQHFLNLSFYGDK